MYGLVNEELIALKIEIGKLVIESDDF